MTVATRDSRGSRGLEVSSAKGAQRERAKERARNEHWRPRWRTLWATLMKNCEPPELGRPVLAIESEPGTFESREIFSSWMLPPPLRDSLAPVARLTNDPSGGPPVPALLECGSFECGQPN